MKLLFLNLIGILFSINCYAQRLMLNDSTPCNIEIKINEFTKKKSISTPLTPFNGGTYSIYKDKNVITLWIQFESSTHLIIRAGEIIYIKFTDNSILKLVNSSTDYGDYSTYTNLYTNSFIFNLTGTKLEQFSKKQVNGIKCYINEYVLTELYSEELQNYINCIKKAK